MAYANSDLSNVANYQLLGVTIEGTVPATPQSPVILEGGVGDRYVLRHSYAPRINATCNPNRGATVNVDGVTALVGGPLLNSVAEARSDLLVYDTPSPNLVNNNVTGVQGRAIITTNGQVANDVINIFAGSDFCGTTPAATNFNMCGREIDVGSTNPSAVCRGRAGLSVFSIGAMKANYNVQTQTANNDAGVYVTSGYQYGVSNPGWGCAFEVAVGLVPPAQPGGPVTTIPPVIPRGAIMQATGAFSCNFGINFETVSISRSVLKSQTINLENTLAAFSGLNQGVEVGAVGAANTPYIDFHSGRIGADYDSRLLASGGDGTIGRGELYLYSGAFRPNCSIVPTTDNLSILGQPANRFRTAYLGQPVVVASDARLKKDMEPLDPAIWIKFLKALRPVSYCFAARSAGPQKQTRVVKRPKMLIETVLDTRETIVDGQRAFEQYERRVETPVTEQVPLFDQAGLPIMMRGTNTRVESGAEPVDGPIETQCMIEAPVYEEVEEEYEVTPEYEVSDSRTHLGFTAQEIKQALQECGADTDLSEKRSEWFMFSYDRSSDLYMLSYEELLAPLVLGWQELERRITDLELKAG